MRIFSHIGKFVMSLAVMMAAGMGGCDVLHDDLSECDLYLRFRYDYNLAREDWFADQVGAVKVFLFSAEGKYIRTLTESGAALKKPGYRMPIPYKLKGCTAVVWAGKTERFYSLPEMSAGDPIEKLALKYEPKENVSKNHLDTLWHSGPLPLFTEGYTGDTETASLVRNTNDVTVGISRGNTPLDMSAFDIVIKSADGTYNYKNEPSDGTRLITYCPCPEEETPESGNSPDAGEASLPSEVRLHTLRFVKGEDITFSITEKSTGKAIDIGGGTQLDLIGYLLRSKPEGMGDQEYLDRRYLWDIRIRLGEGGDAYLALCITINNWVYWFYPTDL